MSADQVETDVLVVGAGPAGAATALFLARHGVRTLMISRHRGPADTPRAHIVNQRTMEIMRDADLERACVAAGSSGTLLAHSFWLRTMAGEELARAWSWGNDPARLSEYLTASPCSMLDLPQTQMEPILINAAVAHGAGMRFGWELLDFEQDEEGVTARIFDRLTDREIPVRALYLVGADGARSRVVEQLGLTLHGRHGLGEVFNLLCDVDLSAHVVHRHGSLYNIVQPGSSRWGPVAVFRMVRPWDRWLVGLIVPHGVEAKPTEDEFVARVRETIGDDRLPLRLLSVSKWQVNDVYAERLSEGRVFCAGDAVHRHPPANALGSNTCVQDGFNLAWKLALVVHGKAHPSLLDTYDAERQPVAQQIVERANKSFGQVLRIMDLVGGGTRTQRSAAEVDAAFSTADGRAAMREALADAAYNGLAHGVEMTRAYRSDAVVADGSADPESARDPELHYAPSSRPGSVLPHAWLVRREPSAPVSTLDLAGKGAFHLFTGHGGEPWRAAAVRAATALGVPIGVTAIGPMLDREDPYGDWFRLRGVEDDGAVLVRPDLIIAWRCVALPADPSTELESAMRRVLGWAA